MNEYFGKILIASPGLDSTPFCRSVIYVLQDNDDATVGVILNRPADDKVRKAWQGMVGTNAGDDKLSFGGPLPGPIPAIHTMREAGEIALPNGLFTSAKENNLQFLAQTNNIPYQVFFGLTGWQNGQLSDEISQGKWISTEASDEIFFPVKPICGEKRFILSKTVSSMTF